MTDKELVELAAKAAAIKGHFFELGGTTGMFWLEDEKGESIGKSWSPLLNDGDALKLAVRLGIVISPGEIDTACGGWSDIGEQIYEDHGNDPYAATRRVIVRAAAEIGKTK